MSETASSAAPHNSEDTNHILYEEKLYPSFWIWLVILMFGGLAFLVFAPIGTGTGIVAGIVMIIICTVLLFTSTPTIAVTSHTLQVGRATIEREFLGPVTGYRGEDATYQRGPALHGLAYMCLRGWIAPVVRIQITDKRDRTPYWITSTRHPEKLTEALGGAMITELATETNDDDDAASNKNSPQGEQGQS